jgi:hypothetical protein
MAEVNMRRRPFLLVAHKAPLAGCILILLLSILACSVEINTTPQVETSPSPPSSAAGTITALAMTLEALSQAGGTLPPPASGTLTVPPVPTPLPTLTLTLTPLPLTVSVSVETNCRGGPGTVFPVLGVLHPGETAEVVGVSAYHDNWIVMNPDNPGTCWLWDQYASLSGDASAVPTVMPPPTPTPAASFDLAFVDRKLCPAAWTSFNFLITNTGSMTWQSSHVSLSELEAPFYQTEYSWNDFKRSDGCNIISSSASIVPGGTGYTFHNLQGGAWGTVKAVVQVCSQDDLGGICLEKTLTVTP